MEAIQCTETNNDVVLNDSDSNRLLKRNISELAKDGKLNEDFKSPLRKETKISHEAHIRRELEQWKQLLKKGFSDLSESEVLDLDAILKPDQKNFIKEEIDVLQMVQESHAFRRKFDFFLRVKRQQLNIHVDKSNEALDKSKQQALKLRIGFMHCEQFNSLDN
ncbi:uncharacterized protein LOC116346972 [Contarinia nasturtii]|uniref:uncharacterized protein LOC116346972 n=1 Tax=Contarinia nasturtii TaxID=265458 RepID=UPI0012D45990|nr:uncharacterized protein LOC116346972 [Contarinia nasturtii]